MAFISTTHPDEAQGAAGEMYARQRAAWGYLPNYARLFCHRPEVLARWGRLLAEIKRPMDRRRFELATFGAAHELRHTACSITHGQALTEFFSDGEVLAIARGEQPPGITNAEHAMLRFARQVASDARGVTPEQVADLKGHGFSDAEIFDIAAAAAGRAFLTKILDGLGMEADGHFWQVVPELRDPLTVGRPLRAGTSAPAHSAGPGSPPAADAG